MVLAALTSNRGLFRIPAIYSTAFNTQRRDFGKCTGGNCRIPGACCRVRARSLDMSVESVQCANDFHSTVVSSISVDGGEGDGVREKGKDEGCSSSVQSTPDIEKKYVHHVYDAIAPHFSSTRFAKWPKVAAFLNSLAPGSVVLDAGCGNGKYLGFNPGCFFIGCDISPPLVGICAGRGHEVMVADAVNLPYRSGFGDAAISIAVLHHLSTESRRRKAIEELVQVVRKGGLVLITVWAVEQEDRSLVRKWTPLTLKYEEEWISSSSPRSRVSPEISLESIPEIDENGHRDVNRMEPFHIREWNKGKGGLALNSSSRTEEASDSATLENQQEYFVPWHLPYHRAEISGTSASALANGLATKDDKKGAVVYNRYYHVFAEGELQRLVSGVDNAAIIDQFYDKSNWCIVLEKK